MPQAPVLQEALTKLGYCGIKGRLRSDGSEPAP